MAENDDIDLRHIRLFLETLGCTTYLQGVGTDPRELPLPLSLIERIEKWQNAYDDFDAKHCGNLTVTETHTDFPLAQFNEEGCAIADAIRIALPDSKVEHPLLRRD